MASAGPLACSILVLLLSHLAVAAADDDNAPAQLADKAAVQGVVMCQSCSMKGTWSLTNATALPGAKVGVSCKDSKHRVTFYGVFQADSKGYFLAQLDGLKLAENHMDTPFHACKVHLISSPDPHCNLLTNTNRGIGGARLRFVKKQLFGKSEYDLYSAGPLAFRPSDCPPHHHHE